MKKSSRPVSSSTSGWPGKKYIFWDEKDSIKGTVMQIKKALINDHLLVSKVSLKFCISTFYNSAVISPWNLLLSQKVAYFFTVSIVFSVYKQNFEAQ